MKALELAHSDIVAIVACPQNLVCSWLQQSKSYAPIQLRAYQRFSLDQLELEHLVMYNPTRIQYYIQSFMRNNRIPQSTFVSWALQGTHCIEHFRLQATATPKLNDFSIPQTRHWQWHYRYIYPHDSGAFMFYICGMPQSILLQYKLLNIAIPLNLTTITTTRMALLMLYRYVYGNAFRKSQLSVHMMGCNDNVESLFSRDMLQRILRINVAYPLDIETEVPWLLNVCGLFVCNAGEHEEH